MVSAETAGLRRGADLPRESVAAAFDAGAFAYDRLVGANPGYTFLASRSPRDAG